MTYMVNKKVVEGLYDLKWAIKHQIIKVEDLYNNELDETDMEDIANFLENLYWDLDGKDSEEIKFIITEQE